jgi:hypothetical protein
MPAGERIACDLARLVCTIVLNPFASLEQRRALQEMLQKLQPALVTRVCDSVIHGEE